jgi:hypothetical protein
MLVEQHDVGCEGLKQRMEAPKLREDRRHALGDRARHHFMSKTFDIESFVGPAESFAVHRIAKLFCCSVQHVRDLIEEGSIKVPVEEIALAQSKKKTWTAARIPRQSLIKFLRIRTSKRWHKAHCKKKKGRADG